MLYVNFRKKILVLAFLWTTNGSTAFVFPSTSQHHLHGSPSIQTSLNEQVDGNDTTAAVDVNHDDQDLKKQERMKLKQKLLQIGASYDRGFGASPRARKEMDAVIMSLEDLNEETDAARGIEGGGSSFDSPSSPLAGDWRMVWTTAQDVLVLGANPFATVGAIYQAFEPPLVYNIIDLLPRIQGLLPPQVVQNSMLRAKVRTRASPRQGKPMRVGLDFENVELKPVELLGQDVESVLPPLGFDLPKLAKISEDVGFFDVSYLDEDLLIIRQNAPGGLFALAKVASVDP